MTELLAFDFPEGLLWVGCSIGKLTQVTGVSNSGDGSVCVSVLAKVFFAAKVERGGTSAFYIRFMT